MRYLIQILALLVLFEATSNIALNLFTLFAGIAVIEVHDVFHFVCWVLASAGCIGLIFLKEWARRLLIGFMVGRIAWFVWSVVMMPLHETDLVGWFLLAIVLLLLAGLVGVLHRAKALTTSQPQFSRRKWGIACIGVALISPTAQFAIASITADNPENFEPSTDRSLQFLWSDRQWKIGKVPIVSALNARDWKELVVRPSGTLQITKRVSSGVTWFQIDGIPDFRRMEATFSPYENVLILDGTIFCGQPFEQNLRVAARQRVVGTRFKREEGFVHGEVLFGRVESKGSLLILLNLNLGAKKVEKLYLGELIMSDSSEN